MPNTGAPLGDFYGFLADYLPPLLAPLPVSKLDPNTGASVLGFVGMEVAGAAPGYATLLEAAVPAFFLPFIGLG